MIEFRSIGDSDPALAHSPLVRAIEKTFLYIAEHGGIGLTPSKAFKRVFVHWAAEAFDWPHYTKDDLFSLNKVLNEPDFPPLAEIHDLMIALKIGRDRKDRFTLTKAGQSLVDRPGRLFGIVTPFYLFEVDHRRLSRFAMRRLANWEIFLNVLNVEAEGGVSGQELFKKFFGEPETHRSSIEIASGFYLQVLRPLCWTGLLHEHRLGEVSVKARMFAKTPLWHAALRLDTDDMVIPAVQH